MGKNILTAIALIICSVAVSFSQNKPGAHLKFDDTKKNGGFLKEGTPLVLEYKFTNTGTEPIIITDAKAACTCTTIDFPKQPIKPGEKGVIKVTFDTKGKMDRQDRTVELFSNAAGAPHQLRFKCVVLKK
jgi:hypothetical protein